jgi:hypothetical protein
MDIATNDRSTGNASQFGLVGLDDVFGSDEKGVISEALRHMMQASSDTSDLGAADEDPIPW